MVKLSITIPYYKTYELTVKLLDVLIPQLTNEVEVFLIDDGCNEKRLDEYKDKINIKHCRTNKGGAFACNEGIYPWGDMFRVLAFSTMFFVHGVIGDGDYTKNQFKFLREHNVEPLVK